MDNISSIRAFEKNGFLLIGTKNDWVYDGEGFHDEYMFQKILKKKNVEIEKQNIV